MALRVDLEARRGEARPWVLCLPALGSPRYKGRRAAQWRWESGVQPVCVSVPRAEAEEMGPRYKGRRPCVCIIHSTVRVRLVGRFLTKMSDVSVR